jgi:Fe-S cluster assembly iron-binding protein IscA
MNIQTNQETIEAIKAVVSSQESDLEGIRIYIAGSGCSGPTFGLTLDSEGVDDVINKEHGLTFLMAKSNYDQVGDMIVELTDGGYLVKPVTPLQDGCAGCAGSCG